MPALKFEDLASENYRVLVNSRTSNFFVRRLSDETSTYWFTCCEGFEQYRRLKRAWRYSKNLFDRICATYGYHND